MSEAGDIPGRVADEIARAQRDHGRSYASDHEAFAVLLEEVEEIKAWVWKKRRDRVRPAMVVELVQIAAVAQKWPMQLVEAQAEDDRFHRIGLDSERTP